MSWWELGEELLNAEFLNSPSSNMAVGYNGSSLGLHNLIKRPLHLPSPVGKEHLCTYVLIALVDCLYMEISSRYLLGDLEEHAYYEIMARMQSSSSKEPHSYCYPC
jgi:hypothetical protein